VSVPGGPSRFAGPLRDAAQVGAAILLSGVLLAVLDRLLRIGAGAGEHLVPLGAFEYAVITVTVQYTRRQRPLSEDFRDRAIATGIGCVLGALAWQFGGDHLLGAAAGAALGWLAGGLVNDDFGARTAAGVAGILALGSGDPISLLLTRVLAIAAATIVVTLVLRVAWTTGDRPADADANAGIPRAAGDAHGGPA
jgi:hypothetical protein